MRYQAPFNRVAIKPDEADEKIGNIIIPDTLKEKKNVRGTVFSAGPDCKVYGKGDRVFYNKHGGQSVKMKKADGSDFELFVFLEQEILGSISNEEIKGIEGVDYELVDEDESEKSSEISFVPQFAN
jgi:chaperonin GroES